MNRIYSAGYQGRDVAAFCALVRSAGLMVADLRLKPVSRNHVWNKNALVSRLGDRYTWIPELGNLNYKGGPINLQDADAGLIKLRKLLEVEPVVVLCVCADASICHRTVVTNTLALEGFEVLPFAALEQPELV